MDDRKIIGYIANMEGLIDRLERNERRSSAKITKLMEEVTRSGKSKNPVLQEVLEQIQKLSWDSRGLESRLRSNLSLIKGPLSARVELAGNRSNKTPVQRMREILQEYIDRVGFSGDKEVVVAEIGGPNKAWLPELFPSFKHVYLSLWESEEDNNVILADITNCPQISDESFDIIYSQSVFEHITEPWSAAKEITRLLKPGGLTAHFLPFSYFYHEAPVDFWRISPRGMEYLFSDLECVLSEFNSTNRRRNNIGSQENPIDKCGGSQFSIDAFGGWRENWFSLYAGVKPK